MDFPNHVEDLTHTLRRQTERLAAEQGVPLQPPPAWSLRSSRTASACTITTTFNTRTWACATSACRAGCRSCTDWPTRLGELVQPVQPLWDDRHDQVRTPDDGMTEPSEWATDFGFHSPAEL